nr:unnamed protein product [Spirometra erinaceieuropaei]
MEKGYIERVDGNKAFPVTRHWYLPHHPVVNPRKPEKIRVVFDCAAKCQGVSLNDNLYQGPDLNAKLLRCFCLWGLFSVNIMQGLIIGSMPLTFTFQLSAAAGNDAAATAAQASNQGSPFPLDNLQLPSAFLFESDDDADLGAIAPINPASQPG